MPIYIVSVVVGWFAGWLIQQVPSLDPAQAHDVAQAIVDHAWSIGAVVLMTGWHWLRRPGDVPAKSLPAAEVKP